LEGESPAHAGSSLADVSTLKIEGIFSSETSVHTGSTRRYIPEHGILENYLITVAHLPLSKYCVGLTPIFPATTGSLTGTSVAGEVYFH
jgi:hypothetical protein